jgi:inorganic pyrophosphatase
LRKGRRNIAVSGPEMGTEFWTRLDELIASSEIIIDRPKGTAHPRYPDLIFPLDYGYLKGTTGGDGDGIDVWLGTAGRRKLTAIASTVDMKNRDAEIKLSIGCTEEEIMFIKKCHNNMYVSCIINRRETA